MCVGHSASVIMLCTQLHPGHVVCKQLSPPLRHLRSTSEDLRVVDTCEDLEHSRQQVKDHIRIGTHPQADLSRQASKGIFFQQRVNVLAHEAQLLAGT